jgi:hypothetical protein
VKASDECENMRRQKAEAAKAVAQKGIALKRARANREHCDKMLRDAEWQVERLTECFRKLNKYDPDYGQEAKEHAERDRWRAWAQRQERHTRAEKELASFAIASELHSIDATRVCQARHHLAERVALASKTVERRPNRQRMGKG